MLDKLRHHWRQFAAHRPGTRFQAQHRQGRRARRTPFARGVRAVLATVITLIGLVMMPAPGPGMLVVAFGLVMLARESAMAARGLDAAEVRLRPLWARASAWWQRRRSAG